jgi:hypothetical protein
VVHFIFSYGGLTMGQIVSLLDYMINKERKSSKRLVKDEVAQMEEDYYEYIKSMRIVVSGQTLKMDTLYIDCTGDSEATFRDADEKEIHYKQVYSKDVDVDSEDEDLIMSGIIYLAPKSIIISNSLKLNKHLLYAITQIFKERVKITS